MVRYELNYCDLVERQISSDFYIEETNNDAVIKYCIDMFNSKIKWDGMFDLLEAKNRIKNGDKLFVGYCGEKIVVGYCWLKMIESENYYLYNVFINEEFKNRKYGATDLSFLIIKNNTSGKIYIDIDEWNKKSQNVAKKLGFKKTII
jgi:hypothetical protein